ncbi:MAG: hypothetical protein KA004_01175 [Verrucomicrobiales bacterium]|nr:hypothetical protein [Verrucomicrobiales bacterium]
MKRSKRFFALSSGSRSQDTRLSVEDARHLVRVEGGELTPGRAAMRIGTAGIIAAFTAKAILKGKATAIHLALPMAAEYLVLLIALPLLQLKLRHPAIRKDARGGVFLLILLMVAAAVYTAIQAHRQGQGWSRQADLEWTRMWNWIVGHQMHWPMLGAALGVLLVLPGRVRMLYRHGPPFYAVGLGCGMRVAILALGCFLIPWVAGSSARLTWALWAVLLLAEIGAVLMHWDLQRQLKKEGVAL